MIQPHSRRRFLLFTGAAATTVALSACAGTGGGATTTQPGGGGSGGSGSATPLQWWSNHPGQSKELEQQLIDAWTEQNPDVPVQLVDAGADYEEVAQRFNAALTGDQLPDLIVASDVTWFNFALNDNLAPLDELWASEGVDSEDLIDTFREDYLYEGNHYAMPYARSTALMYFNDEVWQKAGLEKRGPSTWQEFEEWAPRIREALGEGKPALVVPDGAEYLEWYFQGMNWAFGGAYSEEWTPTFTKDETIAAGQFLQRMVREGHIQIAPDPLNTFATGQAGALLQSTGQLGGLQETAVMDFTTAFLPGPPPGCPTGGAGIAIPAGISEDRKAKAMRFLDFVTSTENTVMFSQGTGYMPVRKSAMESPEQQQYLEENPNARTAIDQLDDNTAPQDYARVFVPGGSDRIGAGLDRITIGDEDVTTVFQNLQDETQSVIDRQITPHL
ncbi:ABC transporter substrate-binding protein [Kocuria oceani]|uniref:ABC transporter substrate-binding protein n=1 Tax=Kocuria oceani TaxID=988827 RepID=UPI00403603BC